MPSFTTSATKGTIIKTLSSNQVDEQMYFKNTDNIFRGTLIESPSALTLSSTSTIDIRTNGNNFSVSANNLNLSGTTRVVVSKTPFQLATFTTTERDALTPLNGDLILNTSDNKVQARVNGSWVDLH